MDLQGVAGGLAILLQSPVYGRPASEETPQEASLHTVTLTCCPPRGEVRPAITSQAVEVIIFSTQALGVSAVRCTGALAPAFRPRALRPLVLWCPVRCPLKLCVSAGPYEAVLRHGCPVLRPSRPTFGSDCVLLPMAPVARAGILSRFGGSGSST